MDLDSPNYNILRKRTAYFFRQIAKDNPLKRLGQADRIAVAASLNVYDSLARERRSTSSRDLDQISKVAADASQLGKKLESDVFQGHLAEPLLPFVSRFRDIPKQLDRLSRTLGEVLKQFGKRGHFKRNSANRFLVMTSEFVHLRLGQHYDEHLAELLQAISGRPLSKDVSGDAIRKKREYMKRHYPQLYESARGDAHRFSRRVGSAAKPE